MRITHVNITARASAVDGVRSAVHHIAEAQRERGAEVVVADAEWLAAHPAPLSADHPVLAEADVVHLHSVFRPRHVQIAQWCRGNGVPYLVSPHSGLSAGSLARQAVRKRAWIVAFDRRLLADARAVVCLTPVEEREVRRIAPAARTVVVPNLAPPPSKGPLWTPHAAFPHVVTLARFDVWQKGLDRLAEIARLLPRVRFTVHGDYDGNAPGRARRLIAGAPANLSFSAPVQGAEKAAVLAQASLYLQPSRWEGMSVALLEAFAQGTPCAVSPYIAAGLGERAAQIVATVPEDPLDAATTIRELLEDTPRRAALAAAGRAWMRAATDPEAVVSALNGAYGLSPRASGPSRTASSGSSRTATGRRDTTQGGEIA